MDRINWSDDNLILTEIIASRTGIELDRQILQRRSDDAIAVRERVRLTRDLHDSILQSLTAAALQLQLSSAEESDALRKRLEVVKQLLGREQRRIRQFVQEVSPKLHSIADAMLMQELQRSLAESAEHWGCTTSLSVSPENATIPRRLGGELSLMLAEAVANAVRHGQASNVAVTLEKANGGLRVKIRDNGTGFGASASSHEHQAHGIPQSDPASLQGRTRELGGSLAVASSAAGTELDVWIPVP